MADVRRPDLPLGVRGRTADVTLRDARSGGYAKIEATGSTHEPEACCFRARDRICTSDRILSRLLYRSDRILEFDDGRYRRLEHYVGHARDVGLADVVAVVDLDFGVQAVMLEQYR